MVIIAFASCMAKSPKEKTEDVPENSKQTTLKLIDSLGTVTFNIPVRYDTSFTWTNRSDCGKPCEHEQYRFQSKALPVFEESGFIYEIPDIPIDQFTILHSGYFPFYNGDTSRNTARHEYFKSRLSAECYGGKVYADTSEVIGDRYFSVVYIDGYDKRKRKYFAKVAALTTIKNNEIEFHYDIKTADTININNFYHNSIKLLRTIRLSNGI